MCTIFAARGTGRDPNIDSNIVFISGGIHVRTCICPCWHFDKFRRRNTSRNFQSHQVRSPQQGFIFLLWPLKSLSQSCWSWNEDPPPTSICFYSSSLPIIWSSFYIFRETPRILARREFFILVAKYPKRQMPCLTPLARTSPDVMDL